MKEMTVLEALCIINTNWQTEADRNLMIEAREIVGGVANKLRRENQAEYLQKEIDELKRQQDELRDGLK